eukprot:6462915-Amphidinium_carterae.2
MTGRLTRFPRPCVKHAQSKQTKSFLSSLLRATSNSAKEAQHNCCVPSTQCEILQQLQSTVSCCLQTGCMCMQLSRGTWGISWTNATSLKVYRLSQHSHDSAVEWWLSFGGFRQRNECPPNSGP